MASRFPGGTLINGKRPRISLSRRREEEDDYDEQEIQFERFGNYTQRIQRAPAATGIRAVVAVERPATGGTLRERLARAWPRQYRLEPNGDLSRISARTAPDQQPNKGHHVT